MTHFCGLEPKLPQVAATGVPLALHSVLFSALRCGLWLCQRLLSQLAAIRECFG